MRSRDDFRRGAVAAAILADGYDASSTHPYRLGDCILGKMNLRGKPRVNRQRVQAPKEAWIAGFAVALAESHRRLFGGNDSTGVCEIARNAALTIAVARRAGVSPYDLKELRKAGVR